MPQNKDFQVKNADAFESDFLTIGGVVIRKMKAIHGDRKKAVEKMGEVTGYIFESSGEKCLYLAADKIYCTETERKKAAERERERKKKRRQL